MVHMTDEKPKLIRKHQKVLAFLVNAFVILNFLVLLCSVVWYRVPYPLVVFASVSLLLWCLGGSLYCFLNMIRRLSLKHRPLFLFWIAVALLISVLLVKMFVSIRVNSWFP
jgi:hypothetical protein